MLTGVTVRGGFRAATRGTHAAWVRRSQERMAMEIPSPTAVGGTGLDDGAPPSDAEVARLRAEVARLRAERAALWWAAGHDDLTGLPNRRLFVTMAGSLLGSDRPPAVVLVLDLNGFKAVNDTFGHAAGDHVLRIVARRLNACVGDHLVARLGGDEFAVVLTTRSRPAPDEWWWHPTVVAISTVIAEPVRTADRLLTVTASIGVAPVSGHTPIRELLDRADLAMYQAKASGRSGALDCSVPGPHRPARPAHPPLSFGQRGMCPVALSAEPFEPMFGGEQPDSAGIGFRHPSPRRSRLAPSNGV